MCSVVLLQSVLLDLLHVALILDSLLFVMGTEGKSCVNMRISWLLFGVRVIGAFLRPEDI